MKTIKKEVEIYVVDGKKFLDKEQAKSYNDKLNEQLKYVYYNVAYSPDLTEGRGFYKKTTLAIMEDYPADAIALQYCVKTFGNPLEFVMGVSPMANWVLTKIGKFDTLNELTKMLKQEVSIGIGSYRKKSKRQVIYVNKFGKEVKRGTVN